MEIKNKLNFKGKLWYFISFIVVSAAFLLLEIIEILPSFIGTKIVIYAVTIALFMFAIYAKERYARHKK